MESKRKNVYIALFVITTIIAGCIAVYFGIMGYKDKKELEGKIDDLQNEINNVTEENNENEIKDEKDKEEKQLINTTEDKIEYNKKLNQRPALYGIQYMTIYKEDNNRNFNNGKFNDKEKLGISVHIAHECDTEELNKNRQDVPESLTAYINIDYINDYSKKLFDEEINFQKISNIQNENSVLCDLISGLGVCIYKAKSLILNEKTNVYSLTFDVISTENYDKFLEDSKVETTEGYEIENTYVLKYKKENGNYILLEMDRIYTRH